MGEWADWCEMREHTHLERDSERFKYFKDEEPAVYPEKIEGILDMSWGTKVWEHKWFDTRCQLNGCQALVYTDIIRPFYDEIKRLDKEYDLRTRPLMQYQPLMVSTSDCLRLLDYIDG